MRMLANIVIGDTDDHARNHAMIYDVKRSAWRLLINSAFGKQSLGVGLEGADNTFENALSCCKFFVLSSDEAETLVKNVKQKYAEWPDYCLAQGMKQQNVEIVSKYCRA